MTVRELRERLEALEDQGCSDMPVGYLDGESNTYFAIGQVTIRMAQRGCSIYSSDDTDLGPQFVALSVCLPWERCDDRP